MISDSYLLFSLFFIITYVFFSRSKQYWENCLWVCTWLKPGFKKESFGITDFRNSVRTVYSSIEYTFKLNIENVVMVYIYPPSRLLFYF